MNGLITLVGLAIAGLIALVVVGFLYFLYEKLIGYIGNEFVRGILHLAGIGFWILIVIGLCGVAAIFVYNLLNNYR